MKVAISIPDDIYESADSLAESQGISRSELYATAVAEYLAKHRDRDVTAQLNRIYVAENSRIDSNLKSAQRRAIDQTEW